MKKSNKMDCSIIMPEQTAKEKGIAKSAEELCRSAQLTASILDYGAGWLRNAYYMSDRGFSVSVMETPLQLTNIRSKDLTKFRHVYSTDDEVDLHDAVLCSHVINVIPSLEDRKSVLERIYGLLSGKGFLYIEVPKMGDYRLRSDAVPYEDGFVLGTEFIRTFQKWYKEHEIVDFIQHAGFVVNRLIQTSNSYIVIAEKPSPIRCFEWKLDPMSFANNQNQLTFV